MSDREYTEEFEEWFSKTYPIGNLERTAEEVLRKLIASQAWQASREAIEVELPASMPAAGQAWNVDAQRVENARVSSFNSALRQSKNAIEAAGLKVKPC